MTVPDLIILIIKGLDENRGSCYNNPMVDSLPCPGCHTPLPPEATGCQICMRARTKQEIVRGYSKLREEKDRKRKRPWKILAAVVLLGGAAKVYLDHGERIKAETSRAAAIVHNWVDGMRDPKNYSPVKSAAPDAPPAGPPVAPEDAQRAQLFSSPAPAAAPVPSATPTAAADPPPPGPKPLVKNAWRVTGTVFDLATLKPASYVKIEFAREGAETESVNTDDDGAYEIDLPKGEGWTVSARSPKHRRGQLVDLDPSYRARDADERRAALEQINDGDLTPAPVEWSRKQTKVRLDLVVVPQYWTAIPNN